MAGYANIATTRIHDRRKMAAEGSPTFKVSYQRMPIEGLK
jgi:hypothetical protein